MSTQLTTAAEPDAAFFEPTISDVQSYHAMIVGRSKQLNEAPLLTAKHRDAEKAARDQKKADKWPTVSTLDEAATVKREQEASYSV